MPRLRFRMQSVMFAVAFVAINLAVLRALYATRQIDLLAAGALTWIVLLAGSARALRNRGRVRSFWLGFVGGGALVTLTFVAYRAFPRSAVGEIWWGYLFVAENLIYDRRVLDPLVAFLGGDLTELALAVYSMGVMLLPLLLTALAGGFLARRFPVRPGQDHEPAKIPFPT